ncbi:hypothetical protein C3489_22540 [Streptomyces sp. Ru71]|uniref:hypothetical protein n=1 Tax=Streptomyces sp. Ru71 TaxID=2080746 RepID=UPI000CDE3454|nr:hypothetical protein [Streptomyces sp. Ru71]POX50428.1 hypothetical protein C3489_22540 [Streptomyces sp. Ru71]
MSVSLYYHARRETPLTEAERAEVERITRAHLESFPYADEESLYLYTGGGGEPDQVLAGSTKLPKRPGRLLPVIAHVLDSLTELRRAVPRAAWSVHIDGEDVPWDEDEGYALPGMRDEDLIAELGGP